MPVHGAEAIEHAAFLPLVPDLSLNRQALAVAVESIVILERFR